LALRVPGEGYSRNASYAFIVVTELHIVYDNEATQRLLEHI